MKLTADTITAHGNKRHGQSRSVATGKASPTYRSWVSMLARCNNPKASNYIQWSERPGPKNKTHCKRGHEMTPENTRINRGHRVCRECASMHDKARKSARRSK